MSTSTFDFLKSVMSISIFPILINLFLPSTILLVLFWLLMIQPLTLSEGTKLVGCKPSQEMGLTHI